MGQIESLSQIEQEIIIRQEECIKLLDNREKGVVKHDEYFTKTEQLREEIIRLKEKEDEIKNGNMKALIAKDRLEKITEILQDKNVNHHDTDIMKTMIERIRVIGKRELEIVFTCGIAIKKEIK